MLWDTLLSVFLLLDIWLSTHNCVINYSYKSLSHKDNSDVLMCGIDLATSSIGIVDGYNAAGYISVRDTTQVKEWCMCMC